MKNKLIIISVLVGGIVAGFFLHHFIFMSALPFHRQVIKIELASEEELLARREERKGNHLLAILHRWNAVRLNNPAAIKTLTSKDKALDKVWYAPVALLSLEMTSKELDPEGKGEKIIEAIQRGHLAYLLEKNGYEELSAKQWEEASILYPRDIKQLKSFISKSRAQFNEEIYKKAEDAILGPDVAVNK